MKIGVFGHFGNKNLGDEAIILSVLQNIEKMLPSTVIVGFSMNPQDTASRFNIEAYPIRNRKPISSRKVLNNDILSVPADTIVPKKINTWSHALLSGIKRSIKKNPLLFLILKTPFRFASLLKNVFLEVKFLVRSYKRMKDIDILMISGSNQFLDNFGGPWGFPYTLLKWSILAKLKGAKLYYVCLGAGPIHQRLSKIFIRWATFFADYVSLRDISSKELLEQIGHSENYVFPDLANSLDLSQITPAKLPFELTEKGLPIVGINPMPLYDPRYWHEKDEDKYSEYVEKLVIFSAKLLDSGFPVFFFSTMEKDNYVIMDILDGLAVRRNIEMPFERYALKSDTVHELMCNIAAADITVATRFHGTVLSLLSEKPMLGICYHRKNRELMNDMGQGAYAVDLDSFASGDLWTLFETLVANMASEKMKIQSKKEEYIESLNRQYNLLLKNNVL